MEFVAIALLTALFWLDDDVAIICSIMLGLIPHLERSYADPAKARSIAKASVMKIFIISCEMI